MSSSRPAADVEKPVVRILFAGEVAPEVLGCIGWGLEEEGIPATRDQVTQNATAIALAKRAACESRLHVGIGVSGAFGQVALHHRDLPDEMPLLTAGTGPAARDELVCLGKNAARLVKGNPLCFVNTNAGLNRASSMDSGGLPEDMERIVSGIVEALLNSIHKKE